MNSEQMFFLKCLCDYVHGEITTNSLSSDLDRVVICEHAKKHEVSAILYRQTHFHELKSDYYAQVMHSRMVLNLIHKIDKELESIDHFIVKGPIIAEYYPIPELRSMGDIDVYVHLEDRDKVHGLLMEMGFQLGPKWGEWVYFGNHCCVELHTAIVYKYSQCTSNEKQRTFFNSFWDFVQDGVLDINFHILYLFMHLRKHIMETGVGFRQFMDIAVVTMNCQEIDWNWIQKKACELDMFSFIQIVLKFNEKCFNVASPIEGQKIEDEIYEIMCQKIFSDGVFGFANDENQGNKLMNECTDGIRQMNMKLFKTHFFWPYEKMIRMPEFSWLIGRRYLLPIAWIVRVFLRMSTFGSTRKRYFVTKKETKKRLEYYDYWKIE